MAPRYRIKPSYTELEMIYSQLPKRMADRAVVRNLKVRNSPSTDVRLNAIHQTLRNPSEYRRAPIERPKGMPYEIFNRIMDQGRPEAFTLGRVEELFPELARTAKGTYLGDARLELPDNYAAQYGPYMDHETQNVVLADTRDKDWERPGLTGAQDVATSITHELAHLAQSRGEGPSWAWDGPYMQNPGEINARRIEASAAPKLLRGVKGPLFGLAGVPGLVDMLHNWSLNEGTNPFSEQLRGAANAASPTGNVPDARTMAGASDWVMQALGSNDPANRDVAAQYGADALGGIAEMLRNPLQTVKMLMQMFAQNPNYAAGSAMAMALPGPGEMFNMAKGEAALASSRLADQAEGGLAKGPLNVWTREERGAEELRRLGIEGPPTGYDYHAEPYQAALEAKPADVAQGLSGEFPTAPLGQRMWRNGDEWVHTKRGWTRDVDAPKPKGSAVSTNLLNQMARVLNERGAAWAVEEGIKHGGLDLKSASTHVRNVLSQWRASGVQLTPEQVAWLEIHRAGKYKPKE